MYSILNITSMPIMSYFQDNILKNIHNVLYIEQKQPG